MNPTHNKYNKLSSEISSTKNQLSVKIAAEYKLGLLFVINSRKLLISINDNVAFTYFDISLLE